MRYTRSIALLSAYLLVSVQAVSDLFKATNEPSPILRAQIEAFRPFTYFAKAVTCDPATTLTWTCGKPCEENSDFKPVASGGDGGKVQYWFVGYSPSQKMVIVAHQGTNTSSQDALDAILNTIFAKLDPNYFPDMPEGIEVHAGFAAQHAKVADDILKAVKKAIEENKATAVTTLGHSLGGALAFLSAVYLSRQLEGVDIRTIGYGMPRVGNQQFADYVDENIPFVSRVNNKLDIVPIIPFRMNGYVHSSGELHITDDDQWMLCPGQDNPNKLCIRGAVPYIFDGSWSYHGGPYDGILMGCNKA